MFYLKQNLIDFNIKLRLQYQIESQAIETQCGWLDNIGHVKWAKSFLHNLSQCNDSSYYRINQLVIIS